MRCDRFRHRGGPHVNSASWCCEGVLCCCHHQPATLALAAEPDKAGVVQFTCPCGLCPRLAGFRSPEWTLGVPRLCHPNCCSRGGGKGNPRASRHPAITIASRSLAGPHRRPETGPPRSIPFSLGQRPFQIPKIGPPPPHRGAMGLAGRAGRSPAAVKGVPACRHCALWDGPLGGPANLALARSVLWCIVEGFGWARAFSLNL